MSTKEITVAELQNMFEEGKKVAVLDIRPQQQREEWHIADSIHENAYDGLISGDSTVLDDVLLDKDVPVVTVCAGGKTSLIAAKILQEKGYEAFSLSGGMKAWNYAWNTAELKNRDITLIQVRRAAKGCISYIAGSEDEAIVVDAALEPQVYLEIARKKGWRIKYVMDTHIHADYISRTIELADAAEAAHLFTEGADTGFAFTALKDGEKLSFGGAEFQALHTPGHTPESISYLIGNAFLLTGDTLFTNGVGRPDLKADEHQAVQKAGDLFDSLQKIKTLDDGILVLPAHTSQTVAFDKKPISDTIGELFKNTDLLKLTRSEFIDQTIKRIPAAPANYLQIAAINKTGNRYGVEPADLEAGANRCAVS